MSTGVLKKIEGITYRSDVPGRVTLPYTLHNTCFMYEF